MPELNRKQTTSYSDKIIRQLEAMPDKPYRVFTPEEDEIIRKYYVSKGSDALSKVLGKTRNQICARANKIGAGVRRL